MNKLKLMAFALAWLTSIFMLDSCRKAEVSPNQELQAQAVNAESDVDVAPLAPLANHKVKSWPCLNDKLDTVAYITACEAQIDFQCTPYGSCPGTSVAYPPIVLRSYGNILKNYKVKSWPCLKPAGDTAAYISACEWQKNSKCRTSGSCPNGTTPKAPPVVLP